MTDRGLHIRESGFTLIELLVAMVLFAIAVGMVGSAVVSAIRGAGGGTTGAISTSAIARATAALSDDIAGAETEGRAGGIVRDARDFALAVRTGGDPRDTSPNAAASATVDINDVLVASPTRLVLHVDVSSKAGVECIEWRSSTASTGWQLVRTVSAASNACTGAVLQKTVVLKAAKGATGLDTTPFVYDLVCNRADCGAASGAPSSAPCKPWTDVDGVTGTERRWIVAVRAGFSTIKSQGKSVSGAAGSTTMAIRSRDTQEYRMALGC